MAWAAVIGAGVALVGGAVQNNQAKKAQRANQKGYDAALSEQARQYDQSREDMLPWLEAGKSSLNQLVALQNGDFSSFKRSPDYQFALDQGLQGLDRSAAARGGLYAGGHQADVMKYAQGLASQNYGQYANRLAALAGVGQTAAGNLGSLGANYAGNAGNAAIGAGNARASSFNQLADIYGQTAGALGGQFNNWLQNRNASNGLGNSSAGSANNFGNNLSGFARWGQ